MAAYANDVARSTPLHTSHLQEELAEHKVPDMPSDRLLGELDNAIMAISSVQTTCGWLKTRPKNRRTKRALMR